MNLLSARSRLEELVKTQNLSEVNWLRALDEFDEVPFFTRSTEVNFLREVPEDERQKLLFDVALMELEKITLSLNSLDTVDKYFLCLTFMDWDLVSHGEQAVPTPSLLVSPDWKTELSQMKLTRPRVSEAHFLENWRVATARDDLFVANELSIVDTSDSDARVYVGYVQNRHRFKSVGDFIR